MNKINKKTLWRISVIATLLFVGFLILAIVGKESSTGGSSKKGYTVVLTYYDNNNQKQTKTLSFTKNHGNSLAEYLPASEQDYLSCGFFSEDNGNGDMLFDTNGAQCGGELTDGMKVFAHRMPRENTVYFYDYNNSLLDTVTVKTGDTLSPAIPTYQDGYDFVSWTNGSRSFANSFPFFPSQCTLLEGKYCFTATVQKHKYQVLLDYNESTCTQFNTVQEHYFGDYLTEFPEKDLGNKKIAYWSDAPFGDPYNKPVSSDLTLFAIWMEYRVIEISLPNGTTEQLIVQNDGKPVNLPEYDCPGYEFQGFYANSLFNGSPVQSVLYDGNVNKLYGKYEKITYTLSFRSSTGESILPITYQIGDNVNLPMNAASPRGYHFEGWSLDGDKVLGSQLPTDFYGSVTLIAVFKPNQYSLSLMVDNTLFQTENVYYDEKANLPVPKKEHYDFLGWKDSVGQFVTNEKGESLSAYKMTEGSQYNAAWEPKLYTITFDSNGGSTITALKIRYGETVDISSAKPSKTSMFFEGWFDKALSSECPSTFVVSGDRTVYAKWIKSTPISDAASLKKVIDNPRDNYHLTGNINLKGEEWVPISEYFGVLNGNGFKVYNFTISQNVAQSAFILNNKGVVKNITFDNITFTTNTTSLTGNQCALVCGTNEGTVSNVQITNATMSIRFSTKKQSGGFWVGGLVAVNKGTVSDCSVSLTALLDIDNYVEGDWDGHKCSQYLGTAVGENLGTIQDVLVKSSLQIKEKVTAYLSENGYRRYTLATTNQLRAGGIVGINNGNLKDSRADSQITLTSTSEEIHKGQVTQTVYTARDTHIGGIAGQQSDANSSISGCAFSGTITTSRGGNHADSNGRFTGGILGYMDGGTVSNCMSDAALQILSGYMHMGGIVGKAESGRKVSNVAFYGTITSNSGVDYAAQLVAVNSGVLSQGFVCGKITGKWSRMADVVAENASGASIASILNCGNVGKAVHTDAGSSMRIYENQSSAFFTEQNIFEELGLFDSDYWGVNEGYGIYLKSFRK